MSEGNMKFKGTQGEWHVMRGDVLDKNGRMVASIEGFCPGENEIYDAQLIASAPKLLAALQDMVALVKSRTYPQPDKPLSDWGRAEAAEQIIKQALGEE